MRLQLKHFKRWFYIQTNCSDYRIFKSFLLKNRTHFSTIQIVKNRIATLLKVLLMPMFLRVAEQKKHDAYIVDLKSNLQLRKQYVSKYDNENNVGLISRNPKDAIYISSLNDFYVFVKSYFYAVKSTIPLLLLLYNFDTQKIANFFYLRTKLLLVKPKKVYIFYSYLQESYLIALFAANSLKINVDYIIGNMIMENLRYNYWKNMRICFSNELYQQEYLSFEKIGWIKEENVTHLITGNEFLINKENTSFSYDIGFFSSAYWARKEGLYATGNIEAICNSEYSKNIYSKIESVILKHLVEFSRMHHLKLKIYPHPFEKNLIKEHNIFPPYWSLKNEDNVTIDEDCKNKSSFSEPKVGVLLQSSVFYDRWEHNLYTLCLQFKRRKNKLEIPLKYLGKFSKYGFKNLKELDQKIMQGIKDNE